MTWIVQISALTSSSKNTFKNIVTTVEGNQEEKGIWALLDITQKE